MNEQSLIQNSIRAAVDRVGTQEQFAKLCGVTQSAVFKWLKGRSKPRADLALISERKTGGLVRASDLRPDVFPPENQHEHAA